MTIFASSGIEAFVTENNPKYANRIIKQLYINEHFCCVFKFGIVTNEPGIIRHISFYNKDFMASHPDIAVEKKSDSHDEAKCVRDSKLLIPTLKDFFSKKDTTCGSDPCRYHTAHYCCSRR